MVAFARALLNHPPLLRLRGPIKLDRMLCALRLTPLRLRARASYCARRVPHKRDPCAAVLSLVRAVRRATCQVNEDPEPKWYMVQTANGFERAVRLRIPRPI
eukprot:6207311-Pleurochrysis_carterae.AAC.1